MKSSKVGQKIQTFRLKSLGNHEQNKYEKKLCIGTSKSNYGKPKISHLGLWKRLTSLIRQSGTSGKESSCNEGDIRDVGLILGSERSSGGGNSKPVQNSCLGNPMDRGDWQATVLPVCKELDTTVSMHTHPQGESWKGTWSFLNTEYYSGFQNGTCDGT